MKMIEVVRSTEFPRFAHVVPIDLADGQGFTVDAKQARELAQKLLLIAELIDAQCPTPSHTVERLQ